MVKVLFRRPCHVPPCLINGEGGSTSCWPAANNSLNIMTVINKQAC